MVGNGNTYTSDDDAEVVAANKLENPLKLVPNSEVINVKDGAEVVLKYFKVQDLGSKQFKWVMGLLERNMKKLYKQSKEGWKERKKIKEMTQETSRYLIAYMDDKPVAFSHFQFDMDYGRQVLYCYEIQLEQTVRRFGLGKQIMTILESMASATKLSMVVITVFKHNKNALAFFNTVGYEIDETCPEEIEERDYVIMSKRTL